MSVTVLKSPLHWRQTHFGKSSVEFVFNRPLSRSEAINLHLRIRDYVPPDTCPEGWEPSDKSNSEDWEEA